MSDGPYDFARKRWEAEAEAIGGTRRRGVYMHDEATCRMRGMRDECTTRRLRRTWSSGDAG
jgi:hypothetical protein